MPLGACWVGALRCGVDSVTDIRPLREIEQEAILERIYLKRNIPLAARSLKIGKTTIYRKLREYGVGLTIRDILNNLRKQQELNLEPNRHKL